MKDCIGLSLIPYDIGSKTSSKMADSLDKAHPSVEQDQPASNEKRLSLHWRFFGDSPPQKKERLPLVSLYPPPP